MFRAVRTAAHSLRRYGALDAYSSSTSHDLHSVYYRRSLYLGEHFSRGSLNEIDLVAPVPLAGRKFLASSDAPGFPQFLSGPKHDCPLYVKAENGQASSLALWAKRSREVIDAAYEKYEKDGTAVAILFRGLPIAIPADFSKWLNDLGYERVSYHQSIGLTPEISDFVMTGSKEPSVYTIEPHNEQAYMSSYAKILAMCTFKKALRGGETAIVDNRETARELERRFVEECERKEIRYWQHLPDERSDHKGRVYKSWQQQFNTDDRTEVEAYLEANGYAFEWRAQNLISWKNLPPFIRHVKSNERLWFNQVAANHCSYLQAMPLFSNVQLPEKEYPFHTTFGDGEEIPQALIDNVRCVKWANAVGFRWENGDVLFLDNFIMQHSRLGFEGDRNVGISLLNY